MGNSIIGKFYIPQDNSFCIDHKGHTAYLKPWIGDNKYNPTKHELDARFEIISEPYTQVVKTICNKFEKYCFIKVKSNITGNIYRTLYYKRGVVDTFNDYQNMKLNETNDMMFLFDYMSKF